MTNKTEDTALPKDGGCGVTGFGRGGDEAIPLDELLEETIRSDMMDMILTLVDVHEHNDELVFDGHEDEGCRQCIENAILYKALNLIEKDQGVLKKRTTELEELKEALLKTEEEKQKLNENYENIKKVLNDLPTEEEIYDIILGGDVVERSRDNRAKDIRRRIVGDL